MDNKIKEALKEITKDYQPSERIYNNLLSQMKGDSNMKKSTNIKKLVICFAAVTALMSTGIIAASRYAAYQFSNSSSTDIIDHAPTLQEVEKAVNYTPKFPQEMAGFTLVSAQPGTIGSSDENHNVLEEGKDISFEYKKDNTRITLFTNTLTYEFNEEREATAQINGINVYYTKMYNKFVPVDYEKTPEDQRLIDEGTLNLAYGSEEIEEKYSESISWEENGINYSILAMPDLVGEETLLKMAEAVINS